MNDENPPLVLYYATLEFEDGAIESPHFLIFDTLAEGVITIKEHYRELGRNIERIVMKELIFEGTQAMPEDTHILVPLNDHGVEDDFRDPGSQQMMVADAEEGESEGALMGILPYEQENDQLLCRAFYMGPFVKAQNADEFVSHLLREPFETSQPLDYVWLYRPSGEWKEVGAGSQAEHE